MFYGERRYIRGIGASCRGGGAIAGVFSGVEPTGRRSAGCGVSLLDEDCGYHRERQGTGTIRHFQVTSSRYMTKYGPITVTVETTKGRIRRLETQTSSAQPAAKDKEKPMVLGVHFTLPHAPRSIFPYRPPRPRSGNATIKTFNTVSESVSGVLLGKMEGKLDNAESGGQEKQNETMQKVSHTYPDGRLPNPAARPTSPASSSSPGPVHPVLPSLSTPRPRPHCESGRRTTPASCTRRGALSSSVFPGAIMRTPLGELMGTSLKLWV